MKNDRPIEDENLQAGLAEIRDIMQRRGLAGCAMLVSSEEAAFIYGMHAPWSAMQPDAGADLGFRLRAKSKEDGAAVTTARVLGALHTICQLCDFGYQTAMWMDDLKAGLRKAGIDFEHIRNGGKPLPHLTVGVK